MNTINELEIEFKISKIQTIILITYFRNNSLPMNNKEPYHDVWNLMIKLISEHKDDKVVEHAKMLLGQYNTSAGRRIKNDLKSFLKEHKYIE